MSRLLGSSRTGSTTLALEVYDDVVHARTQSGYRTCKTPDGNIIMRTAMGYHRTQHVRPVHVHGKTGNRSLTHAVAGVGKKAMVRWRGWAETINTSSTTRRGSIVAWDHVEGAVHCPQHAHTRRRAGAWKRGWCCALTVNRHVDGVVK